MSKKIFTLSILAIIVLTLLTANVFAVQGNSQVQTKSEVTVSLPGFGTNSPYYVEITGLSKTIKVSGVVTIPNSNLSSLTGYVEQSDNGDYDLTP